jgi:hypothetical protein
MEDYDEEEAPVDNEAEDDVTFDEDDEEEDPQGNAFLRGVEEAVTIKEEEEEEN